MMEGAMISDGIARILEEVQRLPPEWHSAGSVSERVLTAIATHASAIGGIAHSVETGCGRTTLLLSHLSADHVVFARDVKNNENAQTNTLERVMGSPLLNKGHVTLVEGPTQLTLPTYKFTHRLQLALIDGPHGYPFPDLEYYYFYQQLDPGGLLLVDDTNIPTIGRMFEIIKSDAMFDLLETVDRMAFFRRTTSPVHDPLSDGWWLQGYNKAFYEQMLNSGQAKRRSSPLSQTVRDTIASVTPRFVKDRIRAAIRWID
jgi:Methyltransferase domain